MIKNDEFLNHSSLKNSGTILGIAAGIFLLVAFVLPWFVKPNTYIFTLVITAVLFIGAWFLIVVRKRKSS